MTQKQVDQVGLAITLKRGRVEEAAQSCLAMMTEREWLLLTEFALQVVCLSEAVAAETRAVVAKADTLSELGLLSK